jgi:hypothetical protein
MRKVCQLRIRETSASEPFDEVSKTKDGVKTGGLHYTRINPGDTCLLPGWRPA